MLLFLDETANDYTNLDVTGVNTPGKKPPWPNFWRTNVHKLKRTSMLETTLHVLRLSTYPNVAIPVIVYSWTWYLVSKTTSPRFFL
jgi:hypothetical protein